MADPFDTRDRTVLYNRYVELLIPLKEEYDKYLNNGDKVKMVAAGEKIKNLRYKMLMDNVDHYSVERDVYIIRFGKDPDQRWLDQTQRHYEEIYLMKEMVDIRQQMDMATDPQLRKAIAARAQEIRLRAAATLYLESDVVRFEHRVWMIHYGRDMYPNESKAQEALAIKAWNDVQAMKAADQLKLREGVADHEKKRVNRTRIEYKNHYSETYSGTDMVVFMAFPGYKPIEIGTASTVSYSSYREKKQVRTLGRISAMGITKGPRTISGRLIFTVIREHIIESLRKEIPYLRTIRTLLMDELPPFDILVSFGNEYGAAAGLIIQGVTTVDEQKTLSIEDLFTESIFTYLARGLEPMRDFNATRTQEPYDPLSWFTSSFRRPGSEGLANFKPKELQLYTDVALLPPVDPFYGNVAGWDASKYDWDGMIDASIENEGGELGGDAGDGGGDDGSDGGSGKIDLTVRILTDATVSQPVSGATITWNGKNPKTSSKSGNVSYKVSESSKEVTFEVKKKGYKTHKQKYSLVHDNGRHKTWIPIRITPEKEGQDEALCDKNPAIAQQVGLTKAGGYWYEQGAVGHQVELDGSNFTPQPAMYIMNTCGQKLKNYPCYVRFNVINFKSVKKNNTWFDSIGFFASPKVTNQTGHIYPSKNNKGWQAGKPTTKDRQTYTNENGALIAPAFEYRLFPDESQVRITLVPWKTRTDPADADKKYWVTFDFKLLSKKEVNRRKKNKGDIGTPNLGGR